MTGTGLSSSRFFMWRAVFALAHADEVVTSQEIAYLTESTKDLMLSPTQREILSQDLKTPQDPSLMFSQITEAKDREEFFILSRVLCWSDGDFDVQEKKVMDALSHLKAKREAEDLLNRTRSMVQEIQLNKNQWEESQKEDKPFMDFLNRFLPKSA